MRTRYRRLGVRIRQRLSSTPWTTLKMALLAPMPSARVMMATAVNPGVRRNIRRAYPASCRSSVR